MSYGYYPGCSLHSTGREYDTSLKAVCERLGIELQEVRGWICCGTSPAHATSRLLAVALPMENLRLAREQELSDVVAPCAACFARLKVAHHEAGRHPELAEQLREVLDGPPPHIGQGAAPTRDPGERNADQGGGRAGTPDPEGRVLLRLSPHQAS